MGVHLMHGLRAAVDVLLVVSLSVAVLVGMILHGLCQFALMVILSPFAALSLIACFICDIVEKRHT